jgi:hypothetical protein
MSDCRDSINSRFVDYGGWAIGGIGLTLMFFFYPALVLGIHVGGFYDDPFGPGTIAGIIGFIVLLILVAGSQAGSPICVISLVSCYILTFRPFFQWLGHNMTAEEISYSPNPFDMERFPGFDWSGSIYVTILFILISLCCTWLYYQCDDCE